MTSRKLIKPLAVALGCAGTAVAAPLLAPYLAMVSLPFFGEVLGKIFKTEDFQDSVGKVVINTAVGYLTNLGSRAVEEIPSALSADHNLHLERMLASAYLASIESVEKDITAGKDEELKKQATDVLPLVKTRIRRALREATPASLFPLQANKQPTRTAFANRFSAEHLMLVLSDQEKRYEQLGDEVEIALRRWCNEVDQDVANAALNALDSYGLVQVVKTGEDSLSIRYRLHDLARDFAYGRLTDDEQDSAQSRHSLHYQRVLSSADSLYLSDGKVSKQGLSRFDLEWDNIRLGQSWVAAQPETNKEATRLCIEYPRAFTILNLRLHPHKRIEWLNAMLSSTRRLKQQSAEAEALSNLGLAYSDLGDNARAIEFYEQALKIANETGSREIIKNSFYNWGWTSYCMGDFSAAINYCERALTINREIGDRRGEGRSLNTLGLAHAEKGNVRHAIQFYEQALAIAREIGNRSEEGNVLANLGLAYESLNQTSRAIQFHEQALSIMREIGNRRNEGNVLSNLGMAYSDRNEHRRAIEFYEEALEIMREVANRRNEGRVLGNLGRSTLALGETDRALGFYQESLAIARETNDLTNQCFLLNLIGAAYTRMADDNRAIEFYEEALALSREMGNRFGEGQSLTNLGNLYRKLKEYDKAIDSHKRSLAIDRELGNREGERIDLNDLGDDYQGLGDNAQAIKFYDESLALAREIGDRLGESINLTDLGDIHRKLRDYDKRLIFIKDRWPSIVNLAIVKVNVLI